MADGAAAPEVRAAGALVHRRGATGVEVLVVHRPKYDDWTFPKGKLDPGETFEEAAVREVEEETGLRGELGRALPSTTYTDPDGRPKLVRYWAMAAAATTGVAAADNEVDEVRWLALDDARRALSYERDQAVLDALASSLQDDRR